MKAIGRRRSEFCHVGAAKGHSTLVECVDLGEDLDQSGLARAILAEQRQDFACPEIHADIAQRLRAAELLRDIAHDQDLVAARLDAGVPIGGGEVLLPSIHRRFLSPLGSLAQHPAISR
jgi:hypothetical protein